MAIESTIDTLSNKNARRLLWSYVICQGVSHGSSWALTLWQQILEENKALSPAEKDSFIVTAFLIGAVLGGVSALYFEGEFFKGNDPCCASGQAHEDGQCVKKECKDCDNIVESDETLSVPGGTWGQARSNKITPKQREEILKEKDEIPEIKREEPKKSPSLTLHTLFSLLWLVDTLVNTTLSYQASKKALSDDKTLTSEDWVAIAFLSAINFTFILYTRVVATSKVDCSRPEIASFLESVCFGQQNAERAMAMYFTLAHLSEHVIDDLPYLGHLMQLGVAGTASAFSILSVCLFILGITTYFFEAREANAHFAQGLLSERRSSIVLDSGDSLSHPLSPGMLSLLYAFVPVSSLMHGMEDALSVFLAYRAFLSASNSVSQGFALPVLGLFILSILINALGNFCSEGKETRKELVDTFVLSSASSQHKGVWEWFKQWFCQGFDSLEGSRSSSSINHALLIEEGSQGSTEEGSKVDESSSSCFFSCALYAFSLEHHAKQCEAPVMTRG